MKIIVIGATGTIGREVVKALERDHHIIKAARSHGEFRVDITSKDSMTRLFQQVGSFDAVVSATGAAKFGAFDELTDDD